MTREEADQFLKRSCSNYAAAPIAFRMPETLTRRCANSGEWALAHVAVVLILHADALRIDVAPTLAAEPQQPVTGSVVTEWDETPGLVIGAATALLQPGGHRLTVRFVVAERPGRLRLDIFSQRGPRMAAGAARIRDGRIVEEGSSSARAAAPPRPRPRRPTALPDLITDYP